MRLTGWAPRRLEIDGYSRSQIGYHAHLLVDAGLAKGQDVTHMQSEGPEAIISSPTCPATSSRRLQGTSHVGAASWEWCKRRVVRSR